jgi:hypothetical protein
MSKIKCKKCNTEKSIDLFYLSNGVPKSWCKDCSKEYQKNLYAENPDRAKTRSKNWREKYAQKYSEYRKANRHKNYLYELKNKYGIEKSLAVKMIQEEGARCNICLVPFNDKTKRNLDHCHKTGKVRSFLCRRCNSVLGLVCDSPELLVKMSHYLQKHEK